MAVDKSLNQAPLGLDATLATGVEEGVNIPVADVDGQQYAWVTRPTVAQPLAERALVESAQRVVALTDRARFGSAARIARDREDFPAPDGAASTRHRPRRAIIRRSPPARAGAPRRP